MSQKQDLLFCKIAISNGRVTQDQAKKCLAIANKQEIETGRRPTIGAVFSKYNLMRRQEVQAVYEAIAKRTGMPIPQAGGRPAGGDAARAGGKRKSTFADDAPQKRRVDPNTLWLGVAFGVIFLGIVIGLVLMFILHKKPEKAGSKQPVAVDAPAEPGSATGSPSVAGGGGTGAAAGTAQGGTPGVSPVAPVAMSAENKTQILQVIRDARHASLIKTDQALSMLVQLKAKIAEKNMFVEPGLLAEIERDIKFYKTGDEGAGAEAGGDAAGLDDDL